MKNQSAKGTNSIELSFKFLSSPPQSSVIPYTVQVFGTMQWTEGPVIFVQILQPLHPAMAVRLQDSLSRIQDRHIAIYSLRTPESEH